MAISGSLRAGSLNTALLSAAARVAPPGMELLLYRGLGALPLFNPDLESADPAPVAELRACLIAADAVIIASPEYAHGVSGAIKNALDWMVGNESFVGKPVALFNASPRAVHAQAALQETLTTMSAVVISEASVCLPVLGSGLDADGIAAQAEFAATLAGALRTLQAAVHNIAALTD